MDRKESIKYLKQFAGKKFFALCTRGGGMYRDIYKAAVYRITDNGTTRYDCCWMICIANKSQWDTFHKDTKHTGYIHGRPAPEDIAEAIKSGKINLF